MKAGTFLIVILIVIMGFSVYAYKLRTNYNCDELKAEKVISKRKIAILSYAVSITPAEIKSEVFLNSIKQKFSDVGEHEDIVRLLGLDKAESDGEVVKKTRTLASTLDSMIGKKEQ